VCSKRTTNYNMANNKHLNSQYARLALVQNRKHVITNDVSAARHNPGSSGNKKGWVGQGCLAHSRLESTSTELCHYRMRRHTKQLLKALKSWPVRAKAGRQWTLLWRLGSKDPPMHDTELSQKGTKQGAKLILWTQLNAMTEQSTMLRSSGA